VIHLIPSHENLTAACVAILRHDGLNATREAVLLLGHLRTLEVSVPSRLGIAVSQSALLRRQLKYDDSDDVIKEALLEINDNNALQIYLLGQLYLSLVENSILRNEHTTALKWLNKIHLPMEESPENIPALMWRLFEQKWTTMGRIHRFMGDFKKAKDVLEPCIGLRQYLASNKLVIIARQLADVYVELGEIESAKMLLDHHLAVLQQKRRQDTIPYAKLLLSYADAELRLGQFDSAEARLEEVRTRFEAHSLTTQTDQLDHVRALIACTRISLHKHKWSEVLEQSTTALRLANQYECFTATNHYKGYIHKVRAISHLQLAQADMQAATECVCEPRHYMTGVGTFDRAKAHGELAEALARCMSFDQMSLDVVSTR
jgi:tetratricopeptide (TPR) repeat protein